MRRFFSVCVSRYVHSFSFPAGLVSLYSRKAHINRRMKGVSLLISLLTAMINVTALAERSVGASTPLSSKSTVCSILDYGGIADRKTDISLAIISAFTECVSGAAATLYVPEGNYSCEKFPTRLTLLFKQCLKPVQWHRVLL